MLEPCCDACENVHDHQDSESFDGGVNSSHCFVEAGEADAEDGTEGKLCVCPEVLNVSQNVVCLLYGLNWTPWTAIIR